MKPIYWLTLLSVVLPAKSSAHPMGSKPYSHRLRVQLHQEGVEINYLAVIPERVLAQEMEESGLNEKDFFEKKTEELQRGVGVFFDGVDYPVTAPDQNSSLPVVRGARSTAFEIQIQGPVFRENGTLSVTNANLPEEHAFFHTTVRVESPIIVHDSSLFDHQEDGTVRSWENQWTLDERQRTLTLRVEQWRRHSKRGTMQSAIDSSKQPMQRHTKLFILLGLGTILLVAAMRLKGRKKPNKPRPC